MNLFRLFALTGAFAVALASSLVLLGGRKQTPEQRETLRRQRINNEGRITDGTLLEFHEMQDGNGQAVQWVLYRYDIAGVQYECSQDITPLKELFDLHACHVGDPASVKYDPYNPVNSIVVAENWCGLRT